MNKKIFFALTIYLALSGGCTLAPEYKRPQAPIPGKWSIQPSSESTASQSNKSAVNDTPWRKMITDDKLREVIEIALANNRDLRLAALNVKRARAVYGIQRAALFPAIDATAGGSKQRIPAAISATGNAQTPEQYYVNLGVMSWEVDFFGRIRSLRHSALESFLATEQARRAAQILTISSVTDAYLSLAADRQSLGLASSSFQTEKKLLSLVQQQYEVGLASEIDVAREQTLVDAARSDMFRDIQQVAKDENALNFLTGSPIPDRLQPESLNRIAGFTQLFPDLSSKVLLQRPDVLEAESLLKAANANIGAARAALFPSISLTATTGTASNELSGLFTSGSETWNFAPQINIPIFNAGLWSALTVTKTDREIALTQYEKVIQAAFREVADALAVRGTVDEQIAAQQSLVNASNRVWALSEARFQEGIDSYLGVLDARRSLYAAQQGLVGLQLVKMTNQIQLYAVLGGGAD